MSESNGRATIREVYELLERMESKIDRKFDSQEERLRLLERWRYTLPPTVVLAVSSIVVALVRS